MLPSSSPLNSPPPPFQECIQPQVDCCVTNEVNVVLESSLTLSLWLLLPSSLSSKSHLVFVVIVAVVIIVKITPPSLPGMHPTTGWLLCQKMRSLKSLPLVSLSLSLFIVVIVFVFVFVVTVVIIVKITPPRLEECIHRS